MSLVSSTTYRVTEHTAAHINRQIRHRIEDNLTYFAEHPDGIDDRLEELDRECDIERTLEANAASFSLLGLTLALTVDRRWFALPVGVAAFCCSTRSRAGARRSRCSAVSASGPPARSTRSVTPSRRCGATSTILPSGEARTVRARSALAAVRAGAH